MGSMNQGEAQRSGWSSAPTTAFVALFLLLCGLGTAHAQSKSANKGMTPQAIAGPTVTLSVSPTSTPNYVAPASIAINASAAPYSGTTITEMDIYENGALIKTTTNRVANTTLTGLSAGTYTIQAVAFDSADRSASKTVTVTITAPVNQPPTISLTSPANGQTFTTGNVVTLSVNASDSDGTVSQVGFYVDGGLVGTSTAAPYSYAWTSTTGTHSVYAQAVDNSGATTNSNTANITVNVPVNVPPTVSLTSPANGQTFTTGNVVTLSANASDSDGSVSQVAFYVDGVQVGTSTAAPYSYAWASTVGTHSIYARAIDNAGAGTNSGTVSITVNAPANVPPTVSLTSPANGQTFFTGNVVTLSANASDSDGTVSQVGFYVDGAQVGTSAAAPYSYAWTSTVGTHSIYARAVDNVGGATISGTVSITVNDPAPPPVSESPTPTPLPSAAASVSKTELITYSDNTTKWVMGQVATVTDAGTGFVQSSIAYDPTTAQPTGVYAFGKLKSKFAYNGDGTLATVKDGRDNPTTFSNWMRGVPQTVQYADTTLQSAVVNDFGWIMSITDENGSATGYSYDAMGFLTGITYPAGDSPGWANTTRSFVPVASAEYGIAAGHWRLTEITGNAVKVTYYDALWRPLLVSEYDAANVAGTQRFTATTYDAAGRVSFTSYPSTSSNPTAGVWTLYDALGRVTSVSQDSEQGLLTTTTEYLPSFQTRVTNPRGFATVTSYMAYDQPSTDWPLVINAPDSATTTIARDVFGKPTAITRNGGGTSVIRQYMYNTNQELCRTIEPEISNTFMGYDAAGNLAWSAVGYPDTMVPACTDPPSVAARRVDRSYDARNRLQTLSFPDGVGNQSWTYTPDGLPSQIITYNSANNGTPVINSYSYNHRRLLSGESSTEAGNTFSLGYGYDGNANLAVNTYPDGSSVNYSNNALGQPIQVTSSWGTLASGISYYPNGGMQQFTYGNGIVHTMTQNARQLPSRSTDAGVINYGFSYDVNGNPIAISDDVRGTQYNRTMSYDGLDRLLGASSPSFGGDGVHRFTYDPQDNITSWKLATVKDYASYTYTNNRLTSIQNTAGASVVALAYDVQGNLTNRNEKSYYFDYGNRLRWSTYLESYQYDGQGRRAISFSPAPASVPIFSVYAQNGQLLYQQDQRKHLNIPQAYLSGSVLARWEYDTSTNTGQLKYEHTDALGSPVAITNQAGQVVERTDYEPYGNVIGKPNNDRVGYTGHVMDSATGLTYMQQRYYDPTIGRFLSVDPVTADAATGANFNRYKYAANNPYKFTDPDGRCESIATCQMERDDMAVANGTMTPQEQADRIQARGVGAAVGLGILATGYVAVEATPTVIAGARTLGNAAKSNAAKNILCAVLSCSNGGSGKPSGRWVKDVQKVVETLSRMTEKLRKEPVIEPTPKPTTPTLPKPPVPQPPPPPPELPKPLPKTLPLE